MTDILVVSSDLNVQDLNCTNAIILQVDHWDDFGYRTAYEATYFVNPCEKYRIGLLKIYSKENEEFRWKGKHSSEFIPEEIKSLDGQCCSLWQDLSYYEALKKYFPKEYVDILKRLRDIAFDKKIAEKFKNDGGVRWSLLRESGARKAKEELLDFLEEKKNVKDRSFDIMVNVPYDQEYQKLHFDFERNDILPYRINVIVGKNGIGKTQIMGQMADCLSGFTQKDADLKNAFEEVRPDFARVISVSFSAFDSFKSREATAGYCSYVYCGIQKPNGICSLDELKANFAKSIEAIREKGRFDVWKSIIGELLEKDQQNIIQVVEDDKFDSFKLSSGQHILISSMTELMANIENESIILFDEPELHLHPNAIANVMRMFNKLLETFDSYAIFTTHSPLILQEIPSTKVLVLQRIDNQLLVRSTRAECFGESISAIIDDIFDVNSSESSYMAILDEAIKKMDKEAIYKLFSKGLGLNALIYLESIETGDKDA